MWHRLLVLLRIRNNFDWAPPFAPEVAHPYFQHATLACCDHCGGGSKHVVHKPPFNPQRLREVIAVERQKHPPSYPGEPVRVFPDVDGKILVRDYPRCPVCLGNLDGPGPLGLGGCVCHLPAVGRAQRILDPGSDGPFGHYRSDGPFGHYIEREH